MNNTNKFVTLTPEQINQEWDRSCLADPTGSNQRFVFARAIESAATAPLLARIAELERECVSLRNTLEQARQQMERQKDEWLSWEAKRKTLEAAAVELEAVRKDAERWAMSHLVSKEALTPPEKRQHQNVLNAYFKATGAGLDWVASIDAAIDAAKESK